MLGAATQIPYAAVAPFVVILLGIAILPLVAQHWWESNRNKAIFAAVVSVPTTIYLGFLDVHMIGHAAKEYFQFIFLLGSLYIVSGGIVVRGDLKTSPFTNTGLLILGTCLASFIGTTGASMLLIRPFLRANRVRAYTTHIPIFFIFCVSNAGGLLTPLGDPPLFLGFVRNVPFTWTFTLWPQWLVVNTIIIGIFFLIDYRLFKSRGAPPDFDRKPISMVGAHNFALLAVIILAVAKFDIYFREGAMLVATIISLVSTKKAYREENGFTYHPIAEVGILFIAIFVTMQPALGLLAKHGGEMGLTEPIHFYYATGILSSFLDNAPTYVTFFEVAKTMGESAGPLVGASGVAAPLLTAISLGAVFMGANTYIGNGPNFMVKSICDEAGFQTPTFFGYMVWSVGILGPIWVLVGFLFL